MTPPPKPTAEKQTTFERKPFAITMHKHMHAYLGTKPDHACEQHDLIVWHDLLDGHKTTSDNALET